MTVVVLPTDGSPFAVAAARYAVTPGLFPGPLTVHLIHVSPELSGRPRAFLTPSVMDEWIEQAAAEAFSEVRPILDAAGVAVVEHRLFGEPGPTIVQIAHEVGATMIVMGTHGRGAFLSAVLGSVASRVVAARAVPVLLVPGSAASS